MNLVLVKIVIIALLVRFEFVGAIGVDVCLDLVAVFLDGDEAAEEGRLGGGVAWGGCEEEQAYRKG